MKERIYKVFNINFYSMSPSDTTGSLDDFNINSFNKFLGVKND